MQLYCQIFRAFIVIALTASTVLVAAETNCVDNSNYRSPKLGLLCAQHKDLDCREFAVVGYSNDDVADLLRQCPSSCAVEGCAPAATSSTNGNYQSQQDDAIQTSDKRSRSLRGLLPMSTVSTCPEGWDETCRDDPTFKSKLQLPCSQHVTFDCALLGAIGFDPEDIDALIFSCPCSCSIECGAPTSSPTTSPSPAPTVTASASPSMLPTTTTTSHPTTPSPTMHPTMTPSTSSPTRTPTPPFTDVENNQNVIAQVMTNEESPQQDKDDSLFSSPVFYGSVAGAACVGLVAIVVVTRNLKASRHQGDDGKKSSPRSTRSTSTRSTRSNKSVGSGKPRVTKKSTSPKKQGSVTSRSSVSTSKAGSRTGFKGDCLHTRTFNTGIGAGSTVVGSPMVRNNQEDMTYTESMLTHSTGTKDKEEPRAKRTLQDELDGADKSCYDWSIADVHGVSGLTDWWTVNPENKALAVNNQMPDAAWWDYVHDAHIETSVNGDIHRHKQHRSRPPNMPKKKSLRGVVKLDPIDAEAGLATIGAEIGEMLSNAIVSPFSCDEHVEEESRTYTQRPRSRSRSRKSHTKASYNK